MPNLYIDGMSLRDWLAGQALAGLCTIDENWTIENVTKLSYMMADAMLKAREETK